MQLKALVALAILSLLASISVVAPRLATPTALAFADADDGSSRTYFVGDATTSSLTPACAYPDFTTGLTYGVDNDDGSADEAIQAAVNTAATDGTTGVVIIHLCAGTFDLSAGISVTTGDDDAYVFEGDDSTDTSVTEVRRAGDAPGEFSLFDIEGVRATFRYLTISGAAGGPLDGGAVSSDTDLTADTVYLHDNTTGGAGGGLYSGSRVDIVGSTFYRNVSDSDGGAVFAPVVTVVNSTFVENTAGIASLAGDGGAIRATTSVDVTNGTFVDNSAGSGAGHISVTDGSSGRLTSTDSIYAGGDCVIDVTTSTGTNFTTNESCPGSLTDGTALGLQPLANNGGPTWTVALGTDSVAIDATSGIAADNVCAVSVDQRGVKRPQSAGGLCDVGAYEAWLSTISTQASVRGVELTSGVPSITSGDLVTDVATVTGSASDGSGGFIDPTSGSVDFYYCYDPTTGSNPFTECTSGTTWTFAANDEMSGGTDATDGIATATLEDWSPPNGGGWYLISAVYDSSGGTYAGSSTTGDTVHELIRVLYDTTTATVVDPTTGGFNQTYTDGIKVYGLAPHPSGTPEWYLDPTGKVRIYYCFNLNSMPTDCSAGSGYPITTLSLTDGTSGTDGIGEATLSSWLPPQAGYYLLHAVYRGDDVYAPSEDDGTNEEIFAAYTTVVYTGETYDSVTDGTTWLSATVVGPPPCLVGGSMTFRLEPVGGGAARDFSAGVTSTDWSSGLAVTSGDISAGIYEVRTTIEASAGIGGAECSGGTDVSILTVVEPGDASNGGGWYKPAKTDGTDWSGNPRVNFGYNVSKSVKKSGSTTTTTYRGQLLWLNKNLFRIKGTMYSQTTGTGTAAFGTFTCPSWFTAPLSSIGATGYNCGSATGKGTLQQWSDVDGWVAPRDWTSGITFTITMYDAGQIKTCKKVGKNLQCSTSEVVGDYFGIQVNELPYTAIRESAPTKLQGGSVRVVK